MAVKNSRTFHDHDRIRSLAKTLPVSDVARQVGCSQATVYLAINPKLAQAQRERNHGQKYHQRTMEELLRGSDFHYHQLEKHQRQLDRIEAEIARRRKQTQALNRVFRA